MSKVSRVQAVREEFAKLQTPKEAKTLEEALAALTVTMAAAGEGAAKRLGCAPPTVRRSRVLVSKGLETWRLEMVWPDGHVTMVLDFGPFEELQLSE